MLILSYFVHYLVYVPIVFIFKLFLILLLTMSFDFFTPLKVGLQFSVLQLAVRSMAHFLFCSPFEMCVCSNIWHFLYCCNMSLPSYIIVSISI